MLSNRSRFLAALAVLSLLLFSLAFFTRARHTRNMNPVILTGETESLSATSVTLTETERARTRVQGMSGLIVANEGQWSDEIRYALKDRNVSVYFDTEGFHLRSGQFQLRSRFGGSVEPTAEGEGRARMSYLVGDRTNWRRGMKTWSTVVYPEVWPGVDMLYEGRPGALEYMLRVRPGATLANVRLSYDHSTVEKQDNGALLITRGKHQVTESAPLAFVDGRPVDVSFSVNGDGSYGFEADWNGERELFIDPQIGYATFFGGGNGSESAISVSNEAATAIAVDGNGDILVAGASNGDYPTTPGSYDETPNGTTDVLVLKLSSDGSSVVWATVIGGTGVDEALGLALDSAGNLVLAGNTRSTDFPTTAGAYDVTAGGGDDVFVARLSPDGTTLQWSTFLATTGAEKTNGVAVDGADNVIVAGWSTSAAFPTTAGAYDTTKSSSADVFVAKFNPTGSSLLWSTFIGGSGYDEARAVASDAAGNAYVTGNTSSSNFPTTAGAEQTTSGGGTDGFVARVSADGSTLNWSTYLGGTSTDRGYGLVENGGDVWIAGYTASADFPTTAGAYDTTIGGSSDAFFARVNDGGDVIWSTFLGGTQGEFGYGLALTATNQVVITGQTRSSNFPATAGTFDTSYNGYQDCYIGRLNAAGSALDWATFMGGSQDDIGRAVRVTSAGEVVVAAGAAFATFGGSGGNPTNFQTTAGSHDPTHNGGADGVIVKLNATGTTLVFSTYIGAASLDYGHVLKLDAVDNIYIAGATYSDNLPNATGTQDHGMEAFILRMAANGSAPDWVLYLGGVMEEVIDDLDIDANGTVAFVGTTNSPDFPTTAGVVQNGPPGSLLATGVVTGKVDAAGNLVWSSFLEDTGIEYGKAVRMTPTGEVVVAGWSAGAIDGTAGAYDPSFNGSFWDGFVAKLSADGTNLEWCTFLGGTSDDGVVSMELDANDNVIVVGQTRSANFPTTPGAFDTTFNGGTDLFAASISADGSTLNWSTFVGGSLEEAVVFSPPLFQLFLFGGGGDNITLGPLGEVLVCGWTTSTDIPTSANAWNPGYNGGTDGFAFQLSPDGSTLDWCTYLGGTLFEFAYGIERAAGGQVLVVGTTASTDFNIPNALQGTNGGIYDGFVVQLAPDGSAIQWGTYIGGAGFDFAVSIEVGQGIYVTGYTNSADFPVTANAYSGTLAGGYDVFVMSIIGEKVQSINSPSPDGTYFSGDTVLIDVAFSGPVNVTGTPEIDLNSGGTAFYTGGSGTALLSFIYNVAPGHATPDLDYTSASALTGSISDPAQAGVSLALPTPGSPESLGGRKDILVETTPPVAGAVNDGPGSDIDSQIDRTSLSANWSGFSDPDTGVSGYEWAIGTSPGSADIMPFSSVGLSTSVSASGLALIDGRTMYVTVRATNGAGLTSSATSDGVLIGVAGSVGRGKPSSCSASGGTATALPLILIGLILLIRFRRAFLVLAVILFGAEAAVAQSIGPQEDDPFERTVRRRFQQMEYWDFIARAPYATGRNNVWTSLVHVPSMTDASAYPAGHWYGGVGTVVASTDWTDNSQLGESTWEALIIQETVFLQYAATDSIMLGARLNMGELFQDDDDRIRLYDKNAQIVPDADRGFGLSSLVLTGKIVGEVDIARLGLQADLKVPLADEDLLLTSQTLDVGVTGILTVEIGSSAITANVGVVLPVGGADLFTDDDFNDLDPLIHGGVSIGVPVFSDLVAVLQVEANTSPFGEIQILDETVVGAYLSIRYRMMKYRTRTRPLYRTDEGYLGILVGAGFGDLGSDFTFGLSFDMSF